MAHAAQSPGEGNVKMQSPSIVNLPAGSVRNGDLRRQGAAMHAGVLDEAIAVADNATAGARTQLTDLTSSRLSFLFLQPYHIDK